MTQHIHLVGIGGAGMGPLAKVFLEMGWRVSGSDLQPSETTSYLANLGATIHFSHAAENVRGTDQVVFSSAIPQDNPEVVAARQGQIPVVHRSEVIATLLNERRGIAVGGAHGKTTITSMISWVLEQAGLDPVVVIGARFGPFGPGAKYGSGSFAVAEADESDRSFLRYRPEIAIVSSIEADHLENYNGAFRELVDTYKQFLSNVAMGGIRVLGVDDRIVRDISSEFDSVITYGIDEDAHWTATVEEQKQGSTRFTVYRHGQQFGVFTLTVPGQHNVANALATIAVAKHVGLDYHQLERPLASFPGAQRRFQIIGERRNVLIVDDYAHHPTEIAATLQAAKEGWGRRLIAVFQPHRYSRTSFLMEEFASAFALADEVVLTDIYSPPPEEPIEGVSSAVLAEKIQQQGTSVHLVRKQDDLAAFLKDFVQPDDFVITMGAGSIWRTAYELMEGLRD